MRGLPFKEALRVISDQRWTQSKRSEHDDPGVEAGRPARFPFHLEVAKIPERRPPDNLLLRLRHPQAKPMRTVTLNGSTWNAFDPDREIIRPQGRTGAVVVEVRY